MEPERLSMTTVWGAEALIRGVPLGELEELVELPLAADLGDAVDPWMGFSKFSGSHSLARY